MGLGPQQNAWHQYHQLVSSIHVTGIQIIIDVLRVVRNPQQKISYEIFRRIFRFAITLIHIVIFLAKNSQNENFYWGFHTESERTIFCIMYSSPSKILEFGNL